MQMIEHEQIKKERKDRPPPEYRDRVVGLKWVRTAVWLLVAIRVYELAAPYLPLLLEYL